MPTLRNILANLTTSLLLAVMFVAVFTAPAFEEEWRAAGEAVVFFFDNIITALR